MLKNLLKKSTKPQDTDIEVVFPPTSGVVGETSPRTLNGAVDPVQSLVSKQLLDKLSHLLKIDESFMHVLVDSVAPVLLEALATKYGFEPTDKYQEEIENKKKYINQLDAYLEERKVINQEVESDLQKFLRETTVNLTRALDLFSSNIQQRIKDAETNYGIDNVRSALNLDIQK